MTIRHPYTLTYFKRGEYWLIEAMSSSGRILCELSHIEEEGRPYLITHAGVDSTYPTYSEACSVFMNILRQGR